MEEGDHEPRNVRGLQKPEKVRKWFFPRVSRKECSPANNLIVVQCNLFWISDLQNYKIIHFCCFKPFKKLIMFMYFSTVKKMQFSNKMKFRCLSIAYRESSSWFTLSPISFSHSPLLSSIHPVSTPGPSTVSDGLLFCAIMSQSCSKMISLTHLTIAEDYLGSSFPPLSPDLTLFLSWSVFCPQNTVPSNRRLFLPFILL